MTLRLLKFLVEKRKNCEHIILTIKILKRPREYMLIFQLSSFVKKKNKPIDKCVCSVAHIVNVTCNRINNLDPRQDILTLLYLFRKSHDLYLFKNLKSILTFLSIELQYIGTNLSCKTLIKNYIKSS